MTPAHCSDHITVLTARHYKAQVCITLENSAGAGHKIDVSLWKNNGATEFLNVHGHRTLSAGTDVGHMSISGLIDLAASDTIEVWAATDRGADSDVIFEDMSFSLIGIGGT